MRAPLKTALASWAPSINIIIIIIIIIIKNSTKTSSAHYINEINNYATGILSFKISEKWMY